MTNTGLLHRWHLYDDKKPVYTCIPSEDGVRLVEISIMMNKPFKTIQLTQSEYEAFKGERGLEEMR